MRIVQAIEEGGDDAERVAERACGLNFLIVLVIARVRIEAVKLGIVVMVLYRLISVSKNSARPVNFEAVPLAVVLSAERNSGYDQCGQKRGDENREEITTAHGSLRNWLALKFPARGINQS